MLKRVFGGVLFALALGISSAAADAPVEHSGHTFHVKACPAPSPHNEARCHAHVVTDRNGKPIEQEPLATGASYNYTPQDLWSAYDLSPATGAPGTGPTVAIVDAYGYPNAEADMNYYRQYFGLGACTSKGTNPCFRKMDQNGGANYPKYDAGWAQETALDLQMVSAVCPNCRIVLVEATSATYANLGLAETRAMKYSPTAISNSYGGGESPLYDQFYDPGSKNIAIVVSSGDSGYGVQFPASSEHVTAVGGTSLTRDSSPRAFSEIAWNSAGSGCSAYFPKPSWQNNLGLSGCSKRMVADVAAVADPNTGVLVRFGSSWYRFGGTSVAAPIVAGVYALNGKPSLGAPYAFAADLFDVTSGSNGSCGSYLCNAGVGYDGPTGLGTPNGPGGF
jgi:subtilase family serine protease